MVSLTTEASCATNLAARSSSTAFWAGVSFDGHGRSRGYYPWGQLSTVELWPVWSIQNVWCQNNPSRSQVAWWEAFWKRFHNPIWKPLIFSCNRTTVQAVLTACWSMSTLNDFCIPRYTAFLIVHTGWFAGMVFWTVSYERGWTSMLIESTMRAVSRILTY